MENKPSLKNAGNLLGIVSLGIALIIFLPILYWFFNTNAYGKLEGLPLIILPFLSPIGLGFGVLSIKVSSNKFGKWGIISNAILFLFPFLYYYLGTLIFGP